jgi:hypothetical protein
MEERAPIMATFGHYITVVGQQAYPFPVREHTLAITLLAGLVPGIWLAVKAGVPDQLGL